MLSVLTGLEIVLPPQTHSGGAIQDWLLTWYTYLGYFFPSESYLKTLKWGWLSSGASLHVSKVNQNQPQ